MKDTQIIMLGTGNAGVTRQLKMCSSWMPMEGMGYWFS